MENEIEEVLIEIDKTFDNIKQMKCSDTVVVNNMILQKILKSQKVILKSMIRLLRK